MESDELWSCRQLLSHLESQLLEVSTSPSQVLRNAIAADLLFVVLNFEWMKSDEIKDRIFAIVATLNNCSTLVPILIALLCNVENAKNHKDKINFQHFLKLVVESYPEEVSSSLNEALQNGDQIDFLLGVILGVLKMDEYVATSACSGKLLTTLTLLLKRKSFATESIMIIGEIVTLIVPRALEKSLFLLHSLFQLLTLLLEEHVRHEKCAKQDASNSFNTQSCIWSRLFHMLIVLSPWNTVLFVRDLMCDDKAIAPCITAEVQKIRMPSNMFISDDVASKEVVQMSAEEFEAQLTALRINTMAQRPASPTKIRPVAIAPPPPPCNLWEKFDSVNSPARSTPPPTLLPTFDSQDAERNSQYSPRLDSPRSRSSMSPTYGRLKHNGITSDDALTLAALSLTETQVTPTSPTITRQPTFERQFLSFASRMDSNMTDDSTTLAPGGETSRRTPAADLTEYLNELRSEHQGFRPISIVPQTETEKELVKEVLEDRRRLIEILDANGAKFANRYHEMRMELKKSRQSTFVKLSKYMELCEDLKRKNEHLKQEIQEIETLYTRNEHNSKKAVSYSYMQHLSKERYIVSLQERIKDCENKIIELEQADMAKAASNAQNDPTLSREIVSLQSMISTRNSLIYSLLSRLSSGDQAAHATEAEVRDTATSVSSLSNTWKYTASPEEESFLNNFTDTSLENSLQQAIRVFSRRGSSIDISHSPRTRASDLSLHSIDSNKIYHLENTVKEMQEEFRRSIDMKDTQIHAMENRNKQLQKVLLDTEDRVVGLQSQLGKIQSQSGTQRLLSDEGRPPAIAQFADSPSPDYDQYIRHIENAELMKINKSTITGRREGDSDMYHKYMTREMEQRKDLRKNKKHDNCQPS